jgi:hypothetical protein
MNSKCRQLVLLPLVVIACTILGHARAATADPPTYRLEPSPTPWGDYGHILMHGLSAHLPRDTNGLLQLERTGPFVPPLSFPGLGDIIVTDQLKQELEKSKLTGFSFREVKLARIVRLDWHLWNRKAPSPAQRPKGGEPEDYILAGQHSPELARQMAPLWELVLQKGAKAAGIQTGKNMWDIEVFLEAGSTKGLDFFSADGGCYNFVSERAKRWLEEHAKDCVSFEKGKFRAHL